MHEHFAVHKLNREGLEKARQIAGSFDSLLSQLEQVCVESREFSLTKTKLEEAAFYAKKAMAIDLGNQEVE